ncbi:MAG: hypothetical protein J5I98_36400 [Phaeodactylibacter sp.]|nr:hypothetical protein [Phaeodactylibacter sp.]
MNISKHAPLFLLLFWCNMPAALACNCEPAPQLGAADWNDADIIFTARLQEHGMGLVGMLMFEPLQTFKGEIGPRVTFFFQPGRNHTLLHAVKEFKPGGEWIVFARKQAVDGKTHYRLQESPSRAVCALSRPLQEPAKEDPYLVFIKDMAERAGSDQKFYDKDGQLEAEGRHDGQIPVGEWAYYRAERNTRTSGRYIDGRREGAWLQAREMPDGSARLIRKTIYKDGLPSEIHDYSHTGAVSLKKVLTDSTEIRYYYREDGTVKSWINENLDNKTTHIVSYSETGAIEEERFLEGQKTVRQYWYDENGERVREWVKEE